MLFRELVSIYLLPFFPGCQHSAIAKIQLTLAEFRQSVGPSGLRHIGCGGRRREGIPDWPIIGFEVRATSFG